MKSSTAVTPSKGKSSSLMLIGASWILRTSRSCWQSIADRTARWHGSSLFSTISSGSCQFFTKDKLPSKTTSQHLLWGSDRCLWYYLLIVIRFWIAYMKLANKIFCPPSLHDDVRCHVFLKTTVRRHAYKLNHTENVSTWEYVAEVLKETGFMFMCGFGGS